MRRLLLVLAGMCAGMAAIAQPGGDEAAIRAALAAQVAAWNRADIPAFMQTYEDSPETTFIGAAVRKGYGPILERYKTAYTTPEQMGTLTFNHLEVRLLPGSCGVTYFPWRTTAGWTKCSRRWGMCSRKIASFARAT